MMIDDGGQMWPKGPSNCVGRPRPAVMQQHVTSTNVDEGSGRGSIHCVQEHLEDNSMKTKEDGLGGGEKAHTTYTTISDVGPGAASSGHLRRQTCGPSMSMMSCCHRDHPDSR